jgi:predicted GNAT family acetyltransferase
MKEKNLPCLSEDQALQAATERLVFSQGGAARTRAKEREREAVPVLLSSGCHRTQPHRYLQSSPKAIHIFIARLEGRPAGYALVRLEPNGTANLCDAFTLPEARGRGVYLSLVAHRLAEARKHGSTLAVTRANTRTSAPILMKRGFIPICSFFVLLIKGSLCYVHLFQSILPKFSAKLDMRGVHTEFYIYKVSSDDALSGAASLGQQTPLLMLRAECSLFTLITTCTKTASISSCTRQAAILM